VQERQARMRCGLHVDVETLARHRAVVVYGERVFVDKRARLVKQWSEANLLVSIP
jgi:hypothetical protein